MVADSAELCAIVLLIEMIRHWNLEVLVRNETLVGTMILRWADERKYIYICADKTCELYASLVSYVMNVVRNFSDSRTEPQLTFAGYRIHSR